MTETLNPSKETQTPSDPAVSSWTTPELQVLPIAETAANAGSTGDDGIFFS